MAIIKCKMCGGDLEIMEGSSVAECEYCGSKQTVPSADNEKKLTLFARANRLRAACEFDKAAGVYESIVADFPEEAEAYWGLVLCRYGIEYVDDPATGKKIPTCHRSSFDSIMEDADFEQACENADAIARRVYRDEAKAVEEIRKGIIEVSGKEEPYDIFICYKETDESGDRTVDSVIAQDVYDALTDKGYRVFFSRISLEDKLGTEYEPYIFAALTSAKIMLAFGTDFEYYNAVWVKNEWSRFLKLMAADKSKYLIPCFKGIDAYDMPKEFAKLQAQDMGKVGAMQDLLRGIEKILPKAKPETVTVQQTIVQNVSNGPSTDSLLKRVFVFLEDGDWQSADEYCEKVLDIDPECGEAYLGKLMAKEHIGKREDLKKCIVALEKDGYYQKVMRFGNAALVDEVKTANKVTLNAFKKNKEKFHFAARFISAANMHTVGLRPDGAAIATRYVGDHKYYYGQCNVGDWNDIIAISAGTRHTVGLHPNGKVIATLYSGSPTFNRGQCNVDNWRNIKAVAAGEFYTVGLRADGTVITTDAKRSQTVSTWRKIIAIAIGSNNFGIIGLRSDGTVITSGPYDVGDWKGIVAISARDGHVIGLKSDDTVVAVGKNDNGQCNVSGWTDIVAIAAGNDHTVGLKADRTLVATGKNDVGQCDVSDWRDIVAISTGADYTVGLRADGSIVATGKNDKGQCNVSGWKLFNSIDTLEEECAVAKIGC